VAVEADDLQDCRRFVRRAVSGRKAGAQTLIARFEAIGTINV
jgi:hypothetical protein